MKNIHILPTEKPSRLCYDKDDNLLFAPNTGFDISDGKQNIYITNDEKPKDGDWILSTKDNLLYKLDFKINPINLFFTDKKIILTTDQDLIKDGVQAIDDEFLKWFVKNPTCGFVMTLPDVRGLRDIFQPTGKDLYKIIIPQEEPKCNCGGHPYDNSLCKIHGGIPKEEQCRNPLDCGKTYNKELTTQTITCNKCGKTNTFPFGGDHYCPSLKQETLEEAAFHYSKNKINKNTSLLDFTKGAKWQAKRMYSEEEVEIILKSYKEFIVKELKGLSSFKDKNHWFEQFKKK